MFFAAVTVPYLHSEVLMNLEKEILQRGGTINLSRTAGLSGDGVF